MDLRQAGRTIAGHWLRHAATGIEGARVATRDGDGVRAMRARLGARLCLAALLACALDAAAIVFWLDERRDVSRAGEVERRKLLPATGGILCTDGTTGSGFLVDVGEYVADAPGFNVIATAARVLYDPATGRLRGECAFRPADAPGRHLRIGEHLVGSTTPGRMDPNDWAFARLTTPDALPAPLRIDFERNRDPRTLAGEPLWAVGFVKAWQQVAVAGDCAADADFAPSSQWRIGGEARRLLVHDCDILGSSRGGPLAIGVNDGFRVVAISVGESLEEKHPDAVGMPYDPQRNFFNYARRLDKELEDKLVAFVSRYARVKSPSAAITANRILIRNIQENLNRLGFDSGRADGLLGRQTEDAIRAFQTTLGITPTGRASEELLLLLQAR